MSEFELWFHDRGEIWEEKQLGPFVMLGRKRDFHPCIELNYYLLLISNLEFRRQK